MDLYATRAALTVHHGPLAQRSLGKGRQAHKLDLEA